MKMRRVRAARMTYRNEIWIGLCESVRMNLNCMLRSYMCYMKM